jgi:hypothetical protein
VVARPTVERWVKPVFVMGQAEAEFRKVTTAVDEAKRRVLRNKGDTDCPRGCEGSKK